MIEIDSYKDRVFGSECDDCEECENGDCQVVACIYERHYCDKCKWCHKYKDSDELYCDLAETIVDELDGTDCQNWEPKRRAKHGIKVKE